MDVNNLGAGEFVIFVNSSKTALKLFASGNIVAHLKMRDRRRLSLDVIASIPNHFDGTRIDYERALEQRLMKDLGMEKPRSRPTPERVKNL